MPTKLSVLLRQLVHRIFSGKVNSALAVHFHDLNHYFVAELYNVLNLFHTFVVQL